MIRDWIVGILIFLSIVCVLVSIVFKVDQRIEEANKKLERMNIELGYWQGYLDHMNNLSPDPARAVKDSCNKIEHK